MKVFPDGIDNQHTHIFTRKATTTMTTQTAGDQCTHTFISVLPDEVEKSNDYGNGTYIIALFCTRRRTAEVQVWVKGNQRLWIEFDPNRTSLDQQKNGYVLSRKTPQGDELPPIPVPACLPAETCRLILEKGRQLTSAREDNLATAHQKFCNAMAECFAQMSTERPNPEPEEPRDHDNFHVASLAA